MFRNMPATIRSLAAPHAWLAIGWLIVMCLVVAKFLPWTPSQRFRWQSAHALVDRQYGRAYDLAIQALKFDLDNHAARQLADQARWEQSRNAWHTTTPLADLHPQTSEEPRVLVRQAESAKLQGLASEAEAALTRAVAIDPDHVTARHELGLLMQSLGRTWESLPHVSQLIRQGIATRNYLMMVGAPEFTFAIDDRFIARCQEAAPDEPQFALPSVRIAQIEDRTEEAEQWLRKIVAKHPHHAEAQSRLGSILVQKLRKDEFLDWHERLPPGTEHPLLWHVRGLWAAKTGQRQAAIGCFVRALRLDPNHTAANYQLSQMLVQIGDRAHSEQFAERAKRLAKIEYFISELKALSDQNMMRQVAEHMAALGRNWEAAGWCHVALGYDGHQTWPREMLKDLRWRVLEDQALVSRGGQPALEFDLDQFPLPEFRDALSVPSIETPDRRHPDGRQRPKESRFRYEDVAAAVGIDFDYFNGTTVKEGLQHMLQSTGGGVAVLDYDLDGYPDLYFAQSGPWGIDPTDSKYRDRLFRNTGDGHFEDVTATAGLDNRRYSQGVAAGDFNSDGYPDLYVANVGANRLYVNLGDGTFRDIAQEAGVADENWSLSAAIADLDNDGLPEIYCVNYLVLKEVLERKCVANGHPMGCSPSMFTAEQDRVFHNIGDGSFRDVTVEAGFEVPYGKGLGVVVADFSAQGRLDIFVGNDTTANFYFVNQAAADSRGRLSFAENGLLRGVAYSESGHGQSCMGIATGDVDGNGLLDLFVTNFYEDHNTLYLQRPDNTFWDATRESGLRAPGFNMLGFGTQFTDADLDGWLDLFVSNGHVDRTLATGAPDLMPPQFFENLGGGEFVEVVDPGIGAYFGGEYLGRAVATVDWNGDGKQDLCVSHLDAPAALLTNRTENTGNFIAIELRGVTSNRDAVGAVVRLEAGGRVLTGQMIAGDGYLVSNQRQLLFGLGTAEFVERLTIRWPSGQQQHFSNLQSGRKVIIVENVNTPWELAFPSDL